LKDLLLFKIGALLRKPPRPRYAGLILQGDKSPLNPKFLRNLPATLSPLTHKKYKEKEKDAECVKTKKKS